MLSEARQTQIQEVVDRLAAFRPTKVVVERRPEREARLNEEYQAYRAGTSSLGASEIYQPGFRLAALAGNERVYGIDEWGRLYEPEEKLMEYARQRLGAAAEGLTDDQLYKGLNDAVIEKYFGLFRYSDAHLAEHSVREHLAFLNSDDFVRISHGAYLSWTDGAPGDYTMADHLAGWWYSRNLRIFANLKRITTSAEDRILVVYGAGHVPLLRHLLASSPVHELVDASTYLCR
jgi:hypothetical protein